MTGRRLIVNALWRACDLIDKLPMWMRNHYACQLANLSYRLDVRWGTRVWA